MKENLFRAGLALSVLFLVTFPATGNAEEQKEVHYTSPSGGLRIERNGEKAWVISTKNPDQRTELPPLEGISPFDDEFHASPNEEWIFGTRKMAHGFPTGICSIVSIRNTSRLRRQRKINRSMIWSGHIV